MTFWWALVAVFVASWLLTLLLRRYALAKSLIDIPNARSSHSIPTPRGGGIAIVLSFVSAVLLMSKLGLVATFDFYSLLGSGLLVALIGFADDHGHVAAKWRLLGHFLAASWAVFWLNGLPPLKFFGSTVYLGWLGDVLAIIYLVWMLNLYNFMDGIDGLASIEAITTCLGLALIFLCVGRTDQVWIFLVLAAAVIGFLYWNFPPARIFMGDAGSGFLGITLSILVFQATKISPELLWSGGILLGVFIVDSTWTLIYRMLRGEKIYVAHSSHGYQHAARYYSSHGVVTLGVACINVFWLLPISLLVGLKLIDGLSGLIVAYLPISFLAWRFKSGKAP